MLIIVGPFIFLSYIHLLCNYCFSNTVLHIEFKRIKKSNMASLLMAHGTYNVFGRLNIKQVNITINMQLKLILSERKTNRNKTVVPNFRVDF